MYILRQQRKNYVRIIASLSLSLSLVFFSLIFIYLRSFSYVHLYIYNLLQNISLFLFS